MNLQPMKNATVKAASASIVRELGGATAAAIISIPMAIGYGVTVFAPLGPAFVPQAALIGLNAAIIGGFFAAVLGGTPGQVSGPQASLTMVLTTVVAQVMLAASLPPNGADRSLLIVSLVSFCVLIGGLAQVLLGLFKLGNLIKYIPHPVLAGFLNGIAILLIWKQLPLMLGLARGTRLTGVLSDFSLINTAALSIGLAALVAVVAARALFTRLPSIVVGLLTGIAVYGLLRIFPVDARPVAVIGDLSFGLPTIGVIAELTHRLTIDVNLPLLYDLCGYGIVLGMLGAMESLMSSSALENLSDIRADSNRELIGQGAGNIAAALAGSISSAGSIIRSHANVRAGGRSRLSGALCSLVMLLGVWALAPAIGKIPLAVFAGVIASVGLTLFDLSVLRFVKFYRPLHGIQKDIFIGFVVHLCVVVITITVSLITAVLVGTLLSAAYFIAKMGMNSIRGRYSGADVTSRKIRSYAQYDCLKAKGKQVQVFELQGPIFFGSADKLARAIESEAREAAFCILDMHRVTEIDATGAVILLRLYKRFVQTGRHLLLTHLKNGRGVRDFLTVTGVLGEIDAQHLFHDADEALEWAEDRVIARWCHQTDRKRYRLQDLEVFAGFTAAELDLFERFLDFRTYRKGAAIITEGQNERDMLMMVYGLVSVSLHLPNSDRQKRLFTFGGGAIIGEMALLDGSPRSADVRADEDSEFYRLTFEAFSRLRGDHPHIALKFVSNIALVISQRLRIRSQEIRLLADG
ncbi:MAG: SulP family inorganic anion transporter [Desulfobacterales bacterium]